MRDPIDVTVLLVEDDKALLKIGERILKNMGYTILAANTPEEALTLAEKHADAIRLLLTDLIMPGMNGHELAAQLKRRNPNLTCVFMSGYPSEIIAHQGVLENEIHFIQKPFSKQNLAAIMQKALAGT